MEILEHANWGRVALTARSLIALHNSGFKLIPPINESPQYRRALKMEKREKLADGSLRITHKNGSTTTIRR